MSIGSQLSKTSQEQTSWAYMRMRPKVILIQRYLGKHPQMRNDIRHKMAQNGKWLNYAEIIRLN